MGLRSQISFLVSHLILKDPFLRAIKTSAVCKAGALKGHIKGGFHHHGSVVNQWKTTRTICSGESQIPDREADWASARQLRHGSPAWASTPAFHSCARFPVGE